MDFWTRLLNHTPLSSAVTKTDHARDPARRLYRFETEYGKLLHTWRNSSNLAHDPDAAERLEIILQTLTSVLQDETRRPLPHPCIQFAALKQMFVPVGKIALSAHSEWLVKEAVLFFAALVESEEEAFVEDRGFSESLTNLLVRIAGVNAVRLGHATEARVVELAFNVTTKIRLKPEILPAWFGGASPGAPAEDVGAGSSSSRQLRRREFPLFHLLVDYIHQEGRVGDFARTGLLYIIEAASTSVELEQWIVESDLSTLMATGLGALYSQLSRKLVVDHPTGELPPVLALSDYTHPDPAAAPGTEAVGSCAPELIAHLNTFLSHLLFWQDVLNHCGSVEIRRTLLEHFHVIFLQQLLYPSLLESSDIDGGSSVAVLTYLRRILESVDHPDMIHLILHYLLALPAAAATATTTTTSSAAISTTTATTTPTITTAATTTNTSPPAPSSPVSDARKRKSMDLLSMVAREGGEDGGAPGGRIAAAPTPLLFNLVDLILACLRSRNQQTIHVTLQLVSAILRHHHRYAIATLLRTTPPGRGRRTIGAHCQEIDHLVALATTVGDHPDAELDETYKTILKDTGTRLESHPCSLKLVVPDLSRNDKDKDSTNNNSHGPALPEGAPSDVLPPHTLSATDPLLETMLDHLETFFLNPVETNLSLTDAMMDLASCGYMSLEGWLLRSPHGYTYDDDDDDNDDGHGDDCSDHGDDPGQNGDDDGARLENPSSFPGLNPAGSAERQMLRSVRRCRRQPRWTPSSLPRMPSVLQRLGDQLALYRSTVPRFDDLLQRRRESFQTADAASTSILSSPTPQPPPRRGAVTPDRASREISRSGSPSTTPRPSGLEGFQLVAQRLFAELSTPSRSGSPRIGRRDTRSTSSGAQTPIATPGTSMTRSALATPLPPPVFPINYGPHRSPGPPPLPRDETGPGHSPFGGGGSVRAVSAGGPVASQAAAFAVIDQQILARRVGMEIEQARVERAREKAKQSSRSSREINKADPGAGRGEQETGADDREGEEEDDEDVTEMGDEPAEPRTATVSHVLTNALLLQSFLLELAALVQIRAGLFGEVRFA